MPRRPARSVPRVFLFADLRGYTAYVERAGDVAGRELLQRYRSLVRPIVARERGAEIKTEGDSFYVVFPSCAAAVRCAMSIQRAGSRFRKRPVQMGIGIHAGESLSLERQYVGGAVNIAARLAAAASGGEILISETARGLVRTALSIRLEDRGMLTLKGLTEPLRAYAIRVPMPVMVAPSPLATSPMEAVRQGNLDEAVRLARMLPPETPPNTRCDALTALAIVSATNGDLEGALSWTERLSTVAPRASDRSWGFAACALRAWCYALAHQPSEATAELERAAERLAPGPVGAMLLLLAASLCGASAHIPALRRFGEGADDPTVRASCNSVADMLAEKPPSRVVIPALGSLCGPLLAEVIELQLTSRTNRATPPHVHHPAAGRLAAMIFDPVQ